ncbi:MAG: DUF4350 domain-containing protein [Candidatus Abyssobacteria bacterium SURF_5]|uniref:DUF4350 domain-containing protein n=1 Tax=Abyssobacteria bacterium (strain SURF_5) TaxID=2093360 RepID=A0A3A4NZN9_ABYX5|nr:MAG: DUF4350 domain-containing protein [Candidatus Abyssubacteria bacterium SURF_5]
MKALTKSAPLLFAAIIVMFAWGLYRLFDLVYEQGNMYPPYSTLRSDPLGTRALYKAMAALEGVSVQQNMSPIEQLGGGKGKTLFICGANLSDDPEYVIKAIEDFVGDGGRLILTFFPITEEIAEASGNGERGEESGGSINESQEEHSKEKSEKKEESSEDEDEGVDPAEEPWFVRMVSIENRWGFKFSTLMPKESENEDYLEMTALKQNGPADWPEMLPWYSALYFTQLSEPWKVLYARNGLPVLVERQWIRGTIVLCSDSYLLSNEAMRRERHTGLIAWLVGPSSTVIFDESHFGIQEHKGIMTLVRSYRLDRPLTALIGLALLFVWKNAFSLTPKHGTPAEQMSRRGKDSAAGLVNLLRRSIPAKKILQVCVEEWERSPGLIDERKRKRVREILEQEMASPARRRNPVEAYQMISAVLAEKE